MILSYNNLINYIMEGSNSYEEVNGIKTLSYTELIKSEDIVFIAVDKSDNTKTLFILFKISRRGDIWSYVTPSKNQVNFLHENLKDFYTAIDINNLICKNKK